MVVSMMDDGSVDGKLSVRSLARSIVRSFVDQWIDRSFAEWWSWICTLQLTFDHYQTSPLQPGEFVSERLS